MDISIPIPTLVNDRIPVRVHTDADEFAVISTTVPAFAGLGDTVFTFDPRTGDCVQTTVNGYYIEDNELWFDCIKAYYLEHELFSNEEDAQRYAEGLKAKKRKVNLKKAIEDTTIRLACLQQELEELELEEKCY